MTITVVRLVQGDVNDIRKFNLNGVEDLTTVTAVEAHVWRRDVPSDTLPGAVTDAVGCTVEIEYGGAGGWLSNAAPLVWRQEIQVLFFDGTILTWPAGSPDMIIVRTGAPSPTP